MDTQNYGQNDQRHSPMANLLLLDESDVAGRAFQGIVARGHHRCFVATKAEDAWRMLREGVVFDLVFLEMKLGASSGLTFLQRLRSDWFWKILPVVVYTSETDSKVVKKALGLKVQNYLIKPYSDESIYAEIAKATQNPWRDLHFEEAKSFCALMELAPEKLRDMRREVMVAFDKAAQTYPAWADARQNEEVFTQTSGLAAQAEEAGVWAGVDFLRDLQEQAAAGNWSAFRRAAEHLDFASRLVFCQLNPSYVPDCMRTDEELVREKEAAECARWRTIDVERSGPPVEAAALLAQVKALGSCPVVDTAAAAFQMVADGRRASMVQVMDLVASDPGLTVQVLAAANRGVHDEMTPIVDARAAAGLLGELKLNALAKSVPLAFERHANCAPFSWAGYWLHQVAVGKLAQFVCSYLDFGYLAATAGTAGLIHDLGRLFLLKLHPFGLQAAIRYAREKKVSLAEAERKHFGCSAREVARAFAELGTLPPVYRHVLRWVDTPEEAEADADLVAMVALARHLCLHGHVGTSGEPQFANAEPLTATSAWRRLQPRVFPSFDAKKFEVQAHAYCLRLRAELTGQRVDHRPTHAERAAELV